MRSRRVRVGERKRAKEFITLTVPNGTNHRIKTRALLILLVPSNHLGFSQIVIRFPHSIANQHTAEKGRWRNCECTCRYYPEFMCQSNGELVLLKVFISGTKSICEGMLATRRILPRLTMNEEQPIWSAASEFLACFRLLLAKVGAFCVCNV